MSQKFRFVLLLVLLIATSAHAGPVIQTDRAQFVVSGNEMYLTHVNNYWNGTLTMPLIYDSYGTHFYVGGLERLHLDTGGTLHYNGSEVATRNDLEKIKHGFVCMLATILLVVFIGTFAGTMLALWIRRTVATAKMQQYRARQPKPDSAPFRD